MSQFGPGIWTVGEGSSDFRGCAPCISIKSVVSNQIGIRDLNGGDLNGRMMMTTPIVPRIAGCDGIDPVAKRKQRLTAT